MGAILWQNPKRDYESNESVRDEDSMDLSESGFLGFASFVVLWKGFEKIVHVVSGLNTKASN